MSLSNHSYVYEFVLVGFPSLQKYSIALFMALLSIYLFIIAGNLLIFCIICQEPSLQFPMYMFIGALSCLELCYTSVTIPKMLADLLNEEKTISFNGCFLQAYTAHSLGVSECGILTIMAYDRYLAICVPLKYNSVMTTRQYINLVVGCFSGGFLLPLIEVALFLPLPFCGPNLIENVFCDFPPLIALACTDTTFYIMAEFCIALFLFVIVSFPFILLSYIRIIYIILRMKNKGGRQKAFSTCGAHLIIVILFFSSCSAIYLQVSKRSTKGFDKVVGLIYAIFTPLANPIIYGLRNQKIKTSIRKHLCFVDFFLLHS